MFDLEYYTKKLVEGLNPLGELIPGRALIGYIGTCCKRLIEPYLSRYEAVANAKTQQKLMTEFPLQRIAICQKMMEDNPQMLPEASLESFKNAVKIGRYAFEYINGDIDKASEVKSLPDEEWMNRFVDEAKYISDEKLQQVFGRLLKEKLYNPDAVNKRVLNILKNIDASELDTIQKYMSCFVEGGIPTMAMENLSTGLDMLLELQNIGIANLTNAPDSFHFIEKTFSINEQNHTIEAKGYQFCFSEIKEPFEISVSSYLMTKEGAVMYNLVSIPMLEDMVKIYEKIFTEACSGKAVLTVRKL